MNCEDLSRSAQRVLDHLRKRHPAGSGEFHEPSREPVAPRHHDRSHAVLDGRQLNGRAVAADHDEPAGRKGLHPAREALGAHGSHHDEQFVALRGRDDVLERAAEHVAHRLQARLDRAGPRRVAGIAKKEIHEVEHRKHAHDPPVGIDHGDRPQVSLPHPLVRVVEGVAEARRHHLSTADVLDLGPHVHDDPRRLHAGPLEHERGSLVRRTAAGRDGVGSRRAPQEVGVGDRRADGVGVGVAMPEDEDAHGRSGDGRSGNRIPAGWRCLSGRLMPHREPGASRRASHPTRGFRRPRSRARSHGSPILASRRHARGSSADSTNSRRGSYPARP